MWMVVGVAMACISAAAADVSSCQHTFPDGQAFDLSPLMRPPRERDWYADDRAGNMYYFNVCSDANEVPAACVAMNKAIQAPAYEVSRDGQCQWLGQLKSMEWAYIDESEPAAGVEVYYFDGEQCPGGIARDIRIQFFCDPGAGMGRPLDYYVLEEQCHYSVTWPSQYGCPAEGATFLFGLKPWTFVWLFVLGVSVYVGGGCAMNVAQTGCEIGPDAMPHAAMWMNVLELAREGVEFTREKVGALLGRRKSSYERVDGVEYEWG